jgi:GNAT superfamily N-acetyltransferase
MEDPRDPVRALESKPNSADVRSLEERLYEFNVQSTGITDGRRFGIFLRGADGTVIGGADGWTWGGTCYVQHFFVPATMRKQGYGRRLMERIEEEAEARRCEQIVVGTHDFQAPDFYRKLGFKLTGTIEEYPHGHQLFTFVKRIAAHKSPDAPRRRTSGLSESAWRPGNRAHWNEKVSLHLGPRGYDLTRLRAGMVDSTPSKRPNSGLSMAAASCTCNVISARIV